MVSNYEMLNFSNKKFVVVDIILINQTKIIIDYFTYLL